MATKQQTTYTMSNVPSWYTNYAQDILANQNAVSSRGFTPFDSTQRVAGFNPTQQKGFDLTQQNAFGFQPALDSAQSALQGAMGRSSVNAMQPLMGQAQSTLQDTLGRSSFAAASPFIQQAAQSSVSDVNNYMNPYLENVVNRYGEIGARTLQEKLIPGVTSKYIGAGQLGGPTRAGTGATGAPSGMMTDTVRALRDVQEGVAQQQQQALAQGYTEALGASAADKARMSTLAGQIASMYGQDTANRLAASGQLAQMAQQMASAYGQDTSNQMSGAGQLATLAQQMQQQGLAGAGAITNVGNQQQGLDQAYRDAKYAEFLRESGYDQAQIDAMTKTMQGVGAAIPQGTTSVQTNKAPSSSMFGTVAGGALTLAGAGGAQR
jgi:hypothetical protein